MRKIDFLWILICCFSTILAGVWGFNSAWVYPEIVVDLKVNSRLKVEIFFDKGDGFRADQAAIFTNNTPDIFSKYRATIPFEYVRSLRIDPADEARDFAIRSVTLRSGTTARILQGSTLKERIIHSHGLDSIEVDGDILHGRSNKADPYSADPYIVLDAGKLTRVHDNTQQRLLMALTAATSVCGGLLYLRFMPVAALISFWIFSIFTIFQFDSSIVHPLRSITLDNFAIFLLSVLGSLFVGIRFSKWLPRYLKNIDGNADALRIFYRAVCYSLAVLILGTIFLPGFLWGTISCSILILCYGGGEVARKVRHGMESIVVTRETLTPGASFLLKLLLLAGVIWLIVDRAPGLLSDPRMWAEDGKHTLVGVLQNPGWSGVFWYEEYFRILSNTAALLSTRVFELEYAAHVFTYIALGILSVPFFIIITGKSPLWNTLPRKLLSCLIVLYAPMSREIWLNVNGCHFYMTLVTVLLLPEIEVAKQKFRLGCYYFLLVIGSFSGILPCVMTPLYWLRTLQTRKRQVMIGAVLLTIGTVIQAILIFNYEGAAPPRNSIATFDMAGWILLIKTMLLPLNEDWAQLIFLHSNKVSSAIWHLTTGQLVLVGYITAILILLWILRRSVAAHFVLAAVGLIMMTMLFGLGGQEQGFFRNPYSGNRYFYMPNVFILLALAAAFQQLRPVLGRAFSTICTVLVFTLVISNSMNLFYNYSVIIKGLPSWSAEIARWRENPSHSIQIWPRMWFVNLPEPR